MRTKIVFLISIFCLRTTTLSDPLKKEFRRGYFPSTHSGYHGDLRGGGRRNIPAMEERRQNLPPQDPRQGFSHDIPQEGMSEMPTFAGAPGAVTDRKIDSKMSIPSEMSTSAIKIPIMPKLDQNNTEPCDVIAYFCLKAYKTGKICGRASNFIYKTFETYCYLDYINCKERTNVWKIAYMGECIPKPDGVVTRQPPQIYDYHDDYFLDDTFVIDETFNEFLDDLEPIHVPLG